MSDYEAALNAYHQAQQNLQYAEGEYIEIAVLQLKAAEEQLSLVLRKLKSAS